MGKWMDELMETFCSQKNQEQTTLVTMCAKKEKETHYKKVNIE